MNEDKSLFSNPEAFHEQLQKTSIESNNLNESQSKEYENASSENTSIPAESNEEQETEEPEIQEQTEQNKDDSYKIPKSRLNQEIEKRKALEDQLMKEREDRIRFETQLQMLTQAKQSTQDITPEPDLNHIDPLDQEAHRAYIKEINELKQMVAQNSQKVQQQQYLNIVTAQEQAFERENPDYKKALEHIKNVEISIANELFNDTKSAHQAVINKMQTMVINAVNNGKNSAEMVYKLAQKYGYNPEKTPDNNKSSPNLKAINENMKKTASINSLGNGANIGSASLKINNMLKDPKNPRSSVDPDKFHELLKKMN